MLLGSIWESITLYGLYIYNVMHRLEQVPKGVAQKQDKGKLQYIQKCLLV